LREEKKAQPRHSEKGILKSAEPGGESPGTDSVLSEKNPLNESQRANLKPSQQGKSKSQLRQLIEEKERERVCLNP